MTVMLKLENPGLSILQSEAAERRITVEELIDQILGDHLRSRGPVRSTDPAFLAAKADTFRENDELYRRLAK
jgi:hypothetical protein